MVQMGSNNEQLEMQDTLFSVWFLYLIKSQRITLLKISSYSKWMISTVNSQRWLWLCWGVWFCKTACWVLYLALMAYNWAFSWVLWAGWVLCKHMLESSRMAERRRLAYRCFFKSKGEKQAIFFLSVLATEAQQVMAGQ